MKPQIVEHSIEPVYDSNSRLLILGTMPSPASREAGFYYMHPQNRFWRVMAELFGASVTHTKEEAAKLALQHRIAIWDVLASCEIVGASDSSIKDPVPNDLARIIDHSRISAVATTGRKAAELYKRYDAAIWPDLLHIELPSTSAANASMRLPDLVEAYKVILPYTG